MWIKRPLLWNVVSYYILDSQRLSICSKKQVMRSGCIGHVLSHSWKVANAASFWVKALLCSIGNILSNFTESLELPFPALCAPWIWFRITFCFIGHRYFFWGGVWDGISFLNSYINLHAWFIPIFIMKQNTSLFLTHLTGLSLLHFFPIVSLSFTSTQYTIYIPLFLHSVCVSLPSSSLLHLPILYNLD